MSSNDKDLKGNSSSLLDSNISKNKTVNKSHDLEQIRQHLAKRSLNVKFDLDGSSYKPVENIGAGAYGVVCSAIHRKTGDRVAIKKTTHVFEVLTVAKRTYREIKILKHFKHDNIISIREILLPKEDVKSFKDIYIVFDLMESDLHHIIYSRQSLSEEHVRYFLYQILRGLKYIHSANVVHRDLKPSNLLVNEDCHLRIGDFGMARGIFYTPDEPSYYMTQYVATRWYRAPEILLSMLEYGTAVDMWSVGCIFAEMMGRKHLFPGKDYMSQVKLILGVLGTPPESLMKSSQNDILKRIIKSFGKKAPEPWHKLFPNASKKSLDLLSKMLVLNPAERITVDEALSHRLLNHYHDPDDEPICVPAFNFDFEKQEMDMACLRSSIMKEIMSFHRPKPPSLSFSAFLRPAPKEENNFDLKQDHGSIKISEKDAEDSQELDQSSDAESQISVVKRENSVESKPSASKKSSPVSIDTSKSQLAPPCVDIEMLSAQSTDSMDAQTVAEVVPQPAKTVPEKPPKETKSISEKKGGNTISEDTKALVKQALLNATQRRQRAESHGDEVDKSKPITAAQRQKEREAKRRKKKERAKEKVKKTKDKGPNEQALSLSSEDVQLLKRWMGMQAPQEGGQKESSPPHPGPSFSPPQPSNSNPGADQSHNTTSQLPAGQELSILKSARQYFIKGSSRHRHILAKTVASSISLNRSVPASTNQLSTSGPVLISSSHANALPSTFIPVIAIPSTTNPGKLEIKRILHAPQQQRGQIVSEPTNKSTSRNNKSTSSLASDNTKNLLQNAIRLRNANTNSSSVIPTSCSHQPRGVLKEFDDKSSLLGQTGERNSSPQEASQNSVGSQPNEVMADKRAPKSDVLLSSFPLKKTQEGAAGNTDSRDLMGNGNIAIAQESPDILDFFNMKTPQDSPSCFTSTSFQNLELKTPNSGNDLTSFPSLNFSPSPTYAFHQSAEQIPDADTNPSVPAFPESVLERESELHNSSHQDQSGHKEYSSSGILHSSHTTNHDNLSTYNPIPFQTLNSHNAMSQVQTDVDIQGSSNSVIFSSTSQVTHEDMLFTEDSHSSLSRFDPDLTGGAESSSSSSSSPFQPSLFQQPNHHAENMVQNHFQSMHFQQTDLPQQQLQQRQPQMFASNHPQRFSVTTATETTTSSLIATTSSTSSLLPTFSPDFAFHSNSPSHFPDYLTQHQQPQQVDHTNIHLQQLQGHQHQQQQQHMFCQERQVPVYSQQHQQPNQHFTNPNHYHHLYQQQQQNYLSHGLYEPSGGSQDPRTLMSTEQSMNVPFSLANATDVTLSSTSLATESSSSYHGMAYKKDFPGKGGQLTVDTRKDKQMMLDPSKDLIALLSKQLSSTQVVDNFPPVLALTPKGTGAGYGLGMDLDSILTDAQDKESINMRAEQSPLSSSLLADWLDVSNISQADLEALEQELVLQSPMHVSYNDVNL